MKNRIHCITIAFLAMAGTSSAQEDCINLWPVSFGYAPFDSDLMEVRIQNNGSGGWSYPSLVFYNTSGDTIAWRASEFFGIGNDQVFTLDITHPEAINGGGVYPGLELWTGFNDSLRCEWVLSGEFCYPNICATVHPYVLSSDPAAAGTTFNWNINSDNGENAASGEMTMALGGVEVMDTVCLPPGNYSLTITNSSVSGNGITCQMRGQQGSTSESPSIEVNTFASSDFTVLEACIDGTNAVAEIPSEELRANIVNGILQLQLPMGEEASTVELFDAAGRVLMRNTDTKTQKELDLSGLAPGVLILSVTNEVHGRRSKTLAWTR
ncbi:MAG: T9SS type A sorting domain-containing protein [Flavobacteriales bacterium]|nr:T9SS type A sorting domain-containing protein [Flavobacteriales bacterium]